MLLLLPAKCWEFHVQSKFQHRAYVAKMQPIWDAEKAAAQAKANRENMIYLAKATGTPIPADF